MSYKKIGKRLTSLAVVLTMFMVSFGYTLAAPASVLSSAQILDLKAFGVISGDLSDEELQKDITRAEFCELLSKLLDAGGQEFAGNTVIYKDIPKDYRAAGDINLLTNLGIVGGDSTGNFYPERSLTVTEAAVMLVKLLGYASYAQEHGGYPAGYLFAAASFRLLNGISASVNDAVSYGEALLMIHNALDVDRLIVTQYHSDGTYETEIGETLRDYLLKKGENAIFKVKGMVSANYDSWIVEPNQELKEDEVEIDGVVVRVGETNAASYLGLAVNAYVQLEDETGKYVIRSISPDDTKNRVVTVDNKDIVKITADEITYTENDKTVTEKIEPNAVLLYNGVPKADWSSIDAAKLKDGRMELVSNNGSREYNVLFLDEYQSFVVSSVLPDAYRINFAHDKRLNGKSGIVLQDNDNKYLKSYIYDADGKPMALEDIKPSDVVSIYIDEDENLIKIYVSANQVDGVVEEIDTDSGTIAVKGKTYDLETEVIPEGNSDKFMGKNVVLNLDYKGKAAYIDDDQTLDSKYVALIAVNQDGLKSPEAKVVYGNVFSDKEEEASPDSYTGAAPAIAAKNQGIGILKFADHVSYDDGTGTRTLKTDEIVPLFQAKLNANANVGGTTIKARAIPLKYQLNAQGQIAKLTAPQLIGKDWNTGKKYNAYEKTFSGDVGNGSYGIRNNTTALCIPEIEQQSIDDNYLADVELNDKQTYAIAGYDFDEDSACAGLILISASMVYDTAGVVDQKYGVVYGVSKRLDENGTEKQVVKMVTSDGNKEYIISDHAGNFNFGNLGSRQLIEYSLNKSDELDAYTLLQKLEPSAFKSYNLIDANTEIFIGDITDIKYNRVSELLNRRADIITISDGAGTMKNYDIQTKSSPPIFIYKAENNTAKLGSHDDLMGDASYAVVFARSVSSSDSRVVPRAVVIVK